MIFQPGSGGSGGLSVVARGIARDTVKFPRPALCVFIIPRNIVDGGYTGVCFPGNTSMVSVDGTSSIGISLDYTGTELSVYGTVEYLALG